MTHQVFISYSNVDRRIADRVCEQLEAAGIVCWMAPRDILAGADWSASIIDALGAAKVLVLVLSDASNGSKQVHREVERAGSGELPIVTLRVEDVRPSKLLEYFISKHHWLDATSAPLEPHLVELVRSVGLLLEREVSVPAPARRVEAAQRPAQAAGERRRLARAPVILLALAVALGPLYLLFDALGGADPVGATPAIEPTESLPAGGQDMPPSTSDAGLAEEVGRAQTPGWTRTATGNVRYRGREWRAEPDRGTFEDAASVLRRANIDLPSGASAWRLPDLGELRELAELIEGGAVAHEPTDLAWCDDAPTGIFARAARLEAGSATAERVRGATTHTFRLVRDAD
ncbi:toll/interleukin-1 receptor domain-containing protein [Engelhardtia mirabilis]